MSATRPNLSSFVELLEIELYEADGWPQLRCHLGAADIVQAGRLIAHGIARRRISVNRRLYDVWQSHALGVATGDIASTDLQMLEAGLLQNVGTPQEPAATNHVNGLVAESLWLEVVTEVDVGLGYPIRVEGHDWSVTDPGGDGLTVYSMNQTGWGFRLWESKYHGSGDPVRDTANLACRQVKSRSLSYLTRFSLIAQTITDDEPLALFYGSLAELWVNRDPAVGVGISIGTSGRDGVDDDNCFGNVTSYFELRDPQHQAQLHLVADFNQLAKQVQIELWKGCGLWTLP